MPEASPSTIRDNDHVKTPYEQRQLALGGLYMDFFRILDGLHDDGHMDADTLARFNDEFIPMMQGSETIFDPSRSTEAEFNRFLAGLYVQCGERLGDFVEQRLHTQSGSNAVFCFQQMVRFSGFLENPETFSMLLTTMTRLQNIVLSITETLGYLAPPSSEVLTACRRLDQVMQRLGMSRRQQGEMTWLDDQPLFYLSVPPASSACI